MAFQKAVKSMARAKLALTGPSGSGKTYSALLLAQGLGGRTAVIDTENRSACLYADKFHGWEFDVDVIEPPYTARKYFDAMEAAIRGGYDVLVIDSISHMWAGEGGLLQQKDALDSRGGNSWQNWGSISKVQEHFKSLLQNSPIHIIATMRSKQEYVMEANERGKQAVKKVGLAPIQREGMEYEFTAVFDIAMDHQFQASKDRTDLFDGVITKVTKTTGEAIKQWLSGDEGSSSQEVRDRFLAQWISESQPKTTVPPRAPAQRQQREAAPAQQPPASPLPTAAPAPKAADLITMGHLNKLIERSELLGFKHAEMREIIKDYFGLPAAAAMALSDYELLWSCLNAPDKAAVMVKLAEMQAAVGPKAPEPPPALAGA